MSKSPIIIGPRDENGQPVPITMDESLAKLKEALHKRLKRSAYVYRVDCGSCNGCEIEFFSTITPLWDAARFGIKLAASPRHADILFFSGAVTRSMRIPAIRAWQSSPDPKITISYGACGNSGGIFNGLYCVWDGTPALFPTDVYIPGCPPTPAQTIYGFALALGLLEQKIHEKNHDQTKDGEEAHLLHSELPYHLCVLIDREARRLAGYRFGRQISDKFLKIAAEKSDISFEQRITKYLQKEDDPRLGEIIGNLMNIYDEAKSGKLLIR